MLLWTIEPSDAGTIFGSDGNDSGFACMFVSETDGILPCGNTTQMPVSEGDQLGCDNIDYMPYGFTSYTVRVRWKKSGKLKLKWKEQGNGPFFEVNTQVDVDVLPKKPLAINVSSSSNHHVSMTASMPSGSNCPNLRFRWRVSTCGGPFGAPTETSTPAFTLNNNFCNCSAAVKVSTVVGTGANEVESAHFQRSFSRVEVPDLLGPDYLCKGSTTNFYLSGLPNTANWYVDAPAYVEYSDVTGAGIYLPDGNYSYGFNLGVTGTYGCGTFSDSKFLSVPELPCTVMAPPSGQTDRSAKQEQDAHLKALPTLLKKGEFLRVELPDLEYDLTIIGMDGKICQKINHASGTTQIQTAELPPGYYQIKAQNGQNIETKRFVIVD